MLTALVARAWQAEATAGYGKKGKEDAYGDCIGGPADPKLVVILQEMKEVRLCKPWRPCF